MSTRADYREWLRIRLAIPTPLSSGLDGAVAGAESPVTKEPNNYVLNNYIENACRIVNQHVGLSGDSMLRTVSIPAQTADGPYSVDLSSVPGYRSRSVISIRRAFWNDGGTSQPVRMTPINLSDQDNRWHPYMSYAPGIPYQYAIEGTTLFLIPAPSAAGSLQFMATTGALAPLNDADSFEGIPESYDPCILYVALVEFGKSYPADAEMSLRAQAFTEDARAGLERLGAWFNMTNEEAQPGVFFNARPFRRNVWAYRR